MKKLLLLINPVTARSALTPHLIDVIDCFEKGGYAVTTHVTQRKNDTQDTVKSIGEQFDTVVCAGGDGTLNETVSAVLELGRKPKVGYIPAGTTNDFAVSWGIPRKPVQAAERIALGEATPIDVSVFNGRPYVYVAAFGAFTEASYATPQPLKQSLGWSAYIFEGMKSLPSIRPIPMRIEYDGGVAEGDFLYGMMSNTRRVGGFDLKMREHISLSDGLMEIILIRRPDNPADNPKMLGAVLMQDTSSEFIVFAHTKSLRFETEDAVSWTIDGENGGEIRKGEIILKEHAVELFL
ncbi:MAG: YegS/Rv2252/BmrU family lipid kinase [Clostridia bacterium]|nr:YegS/Rv2252/BmrU family lipid kinase [Clostridia bacterium]